jgi:hypothetical protein
MFKKIKLIALGLFIALNINVGLVGAVSDIEKGSCEGINIATGGKSIDTDKNGNISDAEFTAAKTDGRCSDEDSTDFSEIITNVINILSILVGAVSVIMLIVGGFRYIISNGDSNSTKGAKDTIMYALIGLIIVLFAQVIVRFVWTNASGSTTTSTVEVDN